MTLFLQGNGLNIIQRENETLNECVCRQMYSSVGECVSLDVSDTPLQGRLASCLLILNVIIIKNLYSSASVSVWFRFTWLLYLQRMNSLVVIEQ